MKLGNASRAKGTGRPRSGRRPTVIEQEELSTRNTATAKPFVIPKMLVWEAWKHVRANQGAAGVDEQSIAAFEENLKDNLYLLWNRLSSGTYFPPPVRAVEIPKKGSGSRTLGIPTVSDRIAQTVVKMTLEPNVEPLFHADSYGYRPGRSALDAVAMCRHRCFKRDWAIDIDIQSFFDTVDHELIMKAVSRHTDQTWVLLYIERWLKAPLQMQDGTLVERDCGTPQGSAISPLLSNIFMHYAFDRWMQRTRPRIGFERYADDVVVHCATQTQAQEIKRAIAKRLAECKLELHPTKTAIVYCKNSNRTGIYPIQKFDFCGYTFRPRLTKSKAGDCFVGFSPAVSGQAKKKIGHDIKRWRLHLRNSATLESLATAINAVVRGWINYYGRFHRSALYPLFKRINEYLIRWARKKYKRLRTSKERARKFLVNVARREPNLFAHWQFGAKPSGWTMGAG